MCDVAQPHRVRSSAATDGARGLLPLTRVWGGKSRHAQTEPGVGRRDKLSRRFPMSLDALLTASSLVQGAEAADALTVALGGAYLVARRQRRPQAWLAAHQNLRISRFTSFTLSGTARNVEVGALRLLCDGSRATRRYIGTADGSC